MKNVSTIILNWQNAEMTIKCVESVIDTYREANSLLNESSKIIVVDNGSDKHIVELLKNWHEQCNYENVSIIFSKDNIGFSAGMNLGIRKTLKYDKPDYIWLLNNDIECETQSLPNLIMGAEEKPDIKIWGATVVNEDRKTIQCAGGCYYNKYLGIAIPAGEGRLITEVQRINPGNKLDYIYGAAMFINAETLKALNGLNEDYFLYFEELDLTHRLQDKSQISWCRKAIVFHRGGSSVINDKILRLTTYHAALSAFKFTRSFYPYSLIPVMLTRCLGKLLHALQRKQYFLVVEVVRAIWVYFRCKLK